jgi:hypothetical protein
MAFWLIGMKTESEKEEMTKTTFRLPKSRLKEVQIYGIENDMTDQEIFNEALAAWLKATKQKRQNLE